MSVHLDTLAAHHPISQRHSASWGGLRAIRSADCDTKRPSLSDGSQVVSERLDRDWSASRAVCVLAAATGVLGFVHLLTRERLMAGPADVLAGATIEVFAWLSAAINLLSLWRFDVSVGESAILLAGSAVLVAVYLEHTYATRINFWVRARYIASLMVKRFLLLGAVLCYLLPEHLSVLMLIVVIAYRISVELSNLRQFEYVSYTHIKSLSEEETLLLRSDEAIEDLDQASRETLERIQQVPYDTGEGEQDSYRLSFVILLGRAANRAVVNLLLVAACAASPIVLDYIIESASIGSADVYRSVGSVLQISVLACGCLLVLQRLADADRRIRRALRLEGSLDVSVEAVDELTDRLMDRYMRGKGRLIGVPQWLPLVEFAALAVAILLATWASELAAWRIPDFADGETIYRSLGFLLAMLTIGILVKSLTVDERTIRRADPSFRGLRSLAGRVPYRDSRAARLDLGMRVRVAVATYAMAPIAVVFLTWSVELAEPRLVSSEELALANELVVRTVGGTLEIIAIPVLAVILFADRLAEGHLRRAEVHNLRGGPRDQVLAEFHRAVARRRLVFAQRGWPVEVGVLFAALVLTGWSAEVADLLG